MADFISKREFVSATQCEKLLWLMRHHTTMMDANHNFEVAKQVDKLAAQHYNADTVIEYVDSFEHAFDDTMKAISGGAKVISHAYLKADNCRCRVNLLIRTQRGFDLVLVKTTTSIKEAAYVEASFATYVAEKCGINVQNVKIVYVNNNYYRQDDLDLDEFFVEEECTSNVRSMMVDMESRIDSMLAISNAAEEPKVDIGCHCEKPDKCVYKEYCRRNIPDNSVFDVNGSFLKPNTQYKLYAQGIITFADVMKYRPKMSENAMTQIAVEYNNSPPVINREELEEFVNKVNYPVYHLDFESFQQVVPLYKGINPYRQICFQYSLHIEHEDGRLEHKEFLAKEGEDPRESFVKRLCEDVPGNACVMVYNSNFEAGRLEELAVDFPEYADQLLSIKGNLVDLMEPFRKRAYYCKEMKGSYSIKYVLPALCPDDPSLDYHSLDEIHRGDEASVAFCDLVNRTPEEVEKTRNNLLKYCCLDTLAMVRVFGKIKDVLGLSKAA